MTLLPLEIWDCILTYVGPSKRAASRDVRSSVIQDYSACAATCRLLSSYARPQLFHTITLRDRSRAEELAALIEDEPMISQWIKDLRMRTRRLWNPKSCSSVSTLQIWLSSDAGVRFVDQLVSLQTLHIEELEDPSHERYHVKPPTTLSVSEGWKTLLRLRSLTSLMIHECDVSSVRKLRLILAGVFPHLRSLHICYSQLLKKKHVNTPSSGSLPIVNSKLRKLVIRDGYPSDVSIHRIVGSMQCNSLVHLMLGPTRGNDAQGFSFHHAQHLLSNAPNLSTLAFTDCHLLSDVDSLPRLDLNIRLKHLSFLEIDEDFKAAWIPDILESLPVPSLLKALEVTGDLGEVSQDVWVSLDQTISQQSFKCSRGERILNISDDSDEGNIDYPSFMRSFLQRTQELEWFMIACQWEERDLEFD